MSKVWVVTDRRYAGQRMPGALVRELDSRGVQTRMVLADDVVHGVCASAGAHDAWGELSSGDLVIARTRNRHGIALVRAAERPGVRVLTTADGIMTIRDKPKSAQVLAEHGVPTPPTYLASSPLALRALDRRRFPLLLKPHAGDNARGIVVVHDPAELEDVDWGGAMVVAQQFVDVGGVDLKVYVAGDQVWGVRRPSPLVADAATAAQVLAYVPVDQGLRLLARRCADAFGLSLCGIDVIETRYGPLVVDVNEFPNYTGIDEAPAAVCALVLDHLPAAVAV